MTNRISRQVVIPCVAVLAVGLFASGCDWFQLGALSGLGGDNPDNAITPANVSTLSAQFSVSDGTTGLVTPQAVVNGVLYASDTSGLEAYSATGAAGCSGSPSTCAPLWSYPTGTLGGGFAGNNNVAVSNGIIYASTSSGLEAFDAAGQTNCTGTPTVCQPLWTASGTFGSPSVSDGTVFLTTTSGVEAFDATGSTNCSGTPTVCSPIWSTSFAGTGSAVAVSGDIAYVEFNSQINGSGAFALDATGTRNCGGTPKVCSPLWYYRTAYPPSSWCCNRMYPIVSGATLYIGTGGPVIMGGIQGNLEAFDANGVKNCFGGPNVNCSPVWSSPNGYAGASPLVVGDGTVFMAPVVPDFPFSAFAADGTNSTSPWVSAVAASPLAVGGSVLYAAALGTVYAFDAGGSAGCSGSSCSPLWSAPGDNAIVANGKLYIGTTTAGGNGEIVAYGLS